MKTNYSIRYAANPKDVKLYDTSRLREDFLIKNQFVIKKLQEKGFLAKLQDYEPVDFWGEK